MSEEKCDCKTCAGFSKVHALGKIQCMCACHYQSMQETYAILKIDDELEKRKNELSSLRKENENLKAENIMLIESLEGCHQLLSKYGFPIGSGCIPNWIKLEKVLSLTSKSKSLTKEKSV